MTALAAAFCVLFVHLGRWQWDKGLRRQAEWDAFARGADQALVLGSRDPTELARFQRVEVTGSFDARRQFLLDNRVHAGQAGYEVLTPLVLADGRDLLVDRGWVPFTGSRDRLPDVDFSARGPVTLTGRVDELPAPGLALGRMPPSPGSHWPKLTSYPDMNQLAAALGHALPGRILLLDPKAPFGYARDWQPPGMSPLRNLSYAVQWWGFALTLIVIWAVLSAPKIKQSATGEAR
jgi:surfeit locus 1 family protein